MSKSPIAKPRFRAAKWGALVAGVALLAAGCSSSGAPTVTVTVPPTSQTLSQVTAPALTAGVSSTSTAPSVSSIAAVNGVRISSVPAFGTKNIAPNNPVAITVFSGKIQNVTMTADDGTTITGKISSDQATWTTSERLDFNTVYQISGSVLSTVNGAPTPIKGTLTTVKPAKTLNVQVNLPDGDVVGIAASIIVTFDGQVTNKAAVEKALAVTTSAGPNLQGNWGWVQDEDFQKLGYLQSQVHWRPTQSPGAEAPSPGSGVLATPYWPAGTKVTLTADLKGVDYGNGQWGKADFTTGFSIRPQAQIIKADANSHRLIVLDNGVITANYPVAYGADAVLGRNTVSGIHVVMDKTPTFNMCNHTYGYCGINEKWAVRINNNGEFIHENDAVIPDLGKANVSHGCINMGPGDAEAFYNTAMYGDPVEVTNTKAQMSTADAIYDWIFSPSQWQSMSALGS